MNHDDSRTSRRNLLGCFAVGSAELLAGIGTTEGSPVRLNREQKERFLLSANVVKVEAAPSGPGDFLRATLKDGNLVHLATIRTTDERGRPAKPARISWKFDLAAYRLDLMLGLNMVPATVEREYVGKPASFVWWVDDVAMDEGSRVKNGAQAPNPGEWRAQMDMARVFDQLIFNVNRNLANVLIDKEWRIWLIDHCWSFQPESALQNAGSLVRCDRGLLARLKSLSAGAARGAMGSYLEEREINALLARRDLIVRVFEEKGMAALYGSGRRTG